MKILIAQINPMVGAFQRNLARIQLAFGEARDKGAELLVLPELAIPGCPVQDLSFFHSFIETNLQAVEQIAGWTRGGGPGVVVGFIAREGAGGGPRFNAAAFLAEGEIRGIARKQILSNDESFDESRSFQMGDGVVVEHRGLVLGLAIGGDLGQGAASWRRRQAALDPAAALAAQGAQLLIHLDASPFAVGSAARREAALAAEAKRVGLPLISCNLVGGNGSLIFDGGSLALDAEGQVLARASSFREQLVMVEVEAGQPRVEAASPREDAGQPLPLPAAEELGEAELDALRDALHLGLRDYAEKSGNHSFLLGLSGGIDSALVAALAVGALGPSCVKGVLLPSRYTASISIEDAHELAENLGIQTQTISIEPVYDALLGALKAALPEGLQGTTEENLQARARGLILMALSNQSGALLLTTGNKSELGVGYCTLYGDMAGALAPIGDLPKTWVYALSRHLNRERELIPERTLTRPPTAELREGQRDDESLPPYDALDRILAGAIQEGRLVAEQHERGEEEEQVRWILSRLFTSEYKRGQAAPSLQVSPRSFGASWRLPLVHRFRP